MFDFIYFFYDWVWDFFDVIEGLFSGNHHEMVAAIFTAGWLLFYIISKCSFSTEDQSTFGHFLFFFRYVLPGIGIIVYLLTTNMQQAMVENYKENYLHRQAITNKENATSKLLQSQNSECQRNIRELQRYFLFYNARAFQKGRLELNHLDQQIFKQENFLKKPLFCPINGNYSVEEVDNKKLIRCSKHGFVSTKFYDEWDTHYNQMRTNQDYHILTP